MKHYNARNGTANGNFTHGMSKTRQYYIWLGMMKRCYNPNEPCYPRYGGRGIAVSKRWRDSFQAFWQDMEASYFDGATIDRIDNDAGYSKENCRWATRADQSRNRSNLRRYRFKGADRLLTEIAALTGIEFRRLYDRIVNHGWDPDRAFTTPIRHSHASR